MVCRKGPITNQVLLADASQLQRAFHTTVGRSVPAATKQLFYNDGYQSVDESQGFKIDTPVYFRHRMNIVLKQWQHS